MTHQSFWIRDSQSRSRRRAGKSISQNRWKTVWICDFISIQVHFFSLATMSNTANHKCVYVNCLNSNRKNKDISFFKFPVKDCMRANKWQKNCGNIKIALTEPQSLKNKQVCEQHFLPSDFIVNNKRKLLKKNAVPIRYGEASEECSMTPQQTPEHHDIRSYERMRDISCSSSSDSEAEISGLVDSNSVAVSSPGKVEDCKKRWRNIKDTYNKRKKKGKGTGSQTKPWSLASLLGFLDKVEHTRPSTSNVNEGEDPLLLDEEELTAGVDEGTSDVPADLKTPSTSTTQKRPSFPFGDSAPTPKKSKQSAEILELLQTSRADCCRILDSLQNREDDVDVFFRSIALSVKKLRPQLVNEAKMRSLQMVFELEQQNDNVPVPQPSPAESTSTSSFLHSETVVKNELNPVAALT